MLLSVNSGFENSVSTNLWNELDSFFWEAVYIEHLLHRRSSNIFTDDSFHSVSNNNAPFDMESIVNRAEKDQFLWSIYDPTVQSQACKVSSSASVETVFG